MVAKMEGMIQASFTTFLAILVVVVVVLVGFIARGRFAEFSPPFHPRSYLLNN